MWGEAQCATTHISSRDIPLVKAIEEATPLVESGQSQRGEVSLRALQAFKIDYIIQCDILCFVATEPLLWPPKQTNS